ncbi:MAG: TetR/AcrR family transcriptional regulator [Anaerolineae bacterium]|nr:TetR/AcrR family transcriptional regulator [Anaerolineae bacterium]
MRKRAVTDIANKEEQILAEAVRIFRQKGYHATSMQNIADAVGLQKASLYHYIPSKQALLSKIFERSIGALTRQLEAIHASADTPTNKLRRAIESHVLALCEQLDTYTVYLSERRALTNRYHARVRAEGEKHARLIERILEEGVARKQFRAMDTKMVALAILGMCNWVYQWYSPEGRLTPQEIANIFADLVLEGIARDK